MSNFKDDLECIVNKGSLDEIHDFMETNITGFFSSPDIFAHYQLVKEVDITTSKKMMPKLVKAWLAFLSGDNASVFLINSYIKECDLCSCYESSIYYSLKAMCSFLSSPKEGLKYAKLSLDVLPKNDSSFYMANAKLTYGQLLANLDQFRAAAEMFASSCALFYEERLYFLSVVALVNELLNKFKLGEFTEVLAECRRALVTSASFKDETQDYWAVVNLPLGMTYYEMNKPSLAKQHLEKAMISIDKMNLFHMHGYIELYLFKSYFALQDKEAMAVLIKEASSAFAHMHYKMTDLLISMFRILSCDPNDRPTIQSEIERIEVEYRMSDGKSNLLLIETLAYLRLKGLSDLIAIKDVVACLERLRYIGMISHQQLFLVLLSQLHCLEERIAEATECLKEAVSIYKDYGICAAFFCVPLANVQLLQNLDRQLYNSLVKIAPQPEPDTDIAQLSAREKDIMQLMAAGKSNDEIGKALFISIGTVKWHINHIFAKLGVTNRIQAIEKTKNH